MIGPRNALFVLLACTHGEVGRLERLTVPMCALSLWTGQWHLYGLDRFGSFRLSFLRWATKKRAIWPALVKSSKQPASMAVAVAQSEIDSSVEILKRAAAGRFQGAHQHGRRTRANRNCQHYMKIEQK
jgi:hypothetical protein